MVGLETAVGAVTEVLTDPFLAFAVGHGILLFGMALYLSFAEEAWDRDHAEEISGQMEDIGEGRAGRLFSWVDQSMRDDPDEDIGPEGPGSVVRWAVVSVVLVAVLIVLKRTLHPAELFQRYVQWFAAQMVSLLPSSVTGNRLFQQYHDLLLWLNDLLAAHFWYVPAVAVLGVTAWGTYGRVTVALLEEHA
jgi:hypothetical protein